MILELNALIFVKGVGEEDILSKHLDVNDYQLLNLDYGMARHYKKSPNLVYVKLDFWIRKQIKRWHTK